jgi:hypothetical protein
MQNLDAWEEAKKETLKIQPHPNRLPEDVPLPKSPTSPTAQTGPSIISATNGATR